MASLNVVGVPFSAVNRENDKTAITVAKADVPVLKDMIQNFAKSDKQEYKNI